MLTVHEFSVVEPPTSEEVRERAFEALRAGDYLSITVLGEQEVPKPEPEDISFAINETAHPKDGGMRLMGRTALDEIVSIVIDGSSEQPAMGNIVKSV